MERVGPIGMTDYPDWMFIQRNKSFKCTLKKKVLISDNLRERSDRGNVVKEKYQEDSDDESFSKLPEELVAKILAMVPYPSVFKARALSKSWLARLSPISSGDDEEKKRLAISFQKQIRQWSTNWKTFCPVHDFSKDDLVAYDRSSRSWQRLQSLSFLDKSLGYGPIEFSKFSNLDHRGSFMLMEGALLLWVVEEELYVANILTRVWKQLPLRPYQGDVYRRRVVLSHTLEAYKVITWPYLDRFMYPEIQNSIHVYDSATASWSSVKVSSSIDVQNFVNAAYVDGVLYFVEYDYHTHLKVMSLNIKEEDSLEDSVTVAEVELSRTIEVLEAYPLICSANLLIIVVYLNNGQNLVVKIDLGRKQLLGLSEGPLDHYPRISKLHGPLTDGDYIFTQVAMDGSGVLAYSIHADQWELLPYWMLPHHLSNRIGFPKNLWMPSCSFRPGLNPFAAV